MGRDGKYSLPTGCKFSLVFREESENGDRRDLRIVNNVSSNCSYVIGWMLGDVVRNFADDEAHEAIRGFLTRIDDGLPATRFMEDLLDIVRRQAQLIESEAKSSEEYFENLAKQNAKGETQ